MSARRPERDQYPLDMAGDLQFYRALCSWQYDEIIRLQGDLQKSLANHIADLSAAHDVGGLMNFTHWSKDPLVPYAGCLCSSCEEARKPVERNCSGSTKAAP